MRKWISLFLIVICNHTLILGQDLDSIGFRKNPVIEKRYILHTGFFVTNKSVEMSVNGSLPSNPIDFGETLGLSRQDNTFGFIFDWRFSKQKEWYASLSYFKVNNTQEVTLEDQIKWNNTIYPVGVVLESGFRMDMYRLFFGRVISKGDRHELSAGLGLHTMNINSFVQASAFVGENFFAFDPKLKRAKVLAPVPNIGLRYVYAPHYRWSFAARAEWFSLTIGDYSGTLWNLAPAIAFQINDYFGIGASYKYFKADLNINRPKWQGATNLLYQGPILSINGTF